jgi:hypothetical protein
MRRLFTAFACLIVLAGCSQEDLLKKIASPEDEATAKQYIDQLRSERFEQIEKDMDTGIAGPQTHDVLVRMAALIPDSEPDSATLVGAHTLHQSNSVTKNLTFEYDFSGKWFLINVATRETEGRLTIVGFNVYPQPASQAKLNAFELAGKSALQYVVLALAAILPLFTLYVLVVCVRTRLTGRKWPWVLFILVGIGKLAVNWTTGAWSVAPLSMQVFSASAVAGLNSPWVVAVSFPLGAIVFLLSRRSLTTP